MFPGSKTKFEFTNLKKFANYHFSQIPQIGEKKGSVLRESGQNGSTDFDQTH
jgi:hypothetical protein